MITWLKKNKKVLLFALLFFIVPEVSHANFVFDAILNIVAWAGNLILGLFALILVVVGQIFDLSIYLSIIGIKDFFSLEAVSLGWAMARDAVNVIFIFMLFWYAFQTVSGTAKADATKTIVSLVLLAVLVNFSGVIVKLVVDGSNIVAIQFYRQITNGGDFALNGSTLKSGQIANFTGVAQKIRNGLNLQRIGTVVQQAEQGPDISDPGKELANNTTSFFGMIAAVFWGIIMIIVTSFILLAASIMFVARTVYLVFLYIIAPLMIGLQILPTFKSNFEDWQKTLISQALFAPAYLFFLMLVLNIIEKGGVGSMVDKTGTNFISSTYNGIVTTSFSFIILIAMMLLSLFVAKKMSAAGMSLAIQGATKGTAVATTFAAGTAARFGRGIGSGAGWVGRGLESRISAATGPTPESYLKFKNWTKENASLVSGAASSTYNKLISQTQKAGLEAMTKSTIGKSLVGATAGISTGVGTPSALAGIGLMKKVRDDSAERGKIDAIKKAQGALGDLANDEDKIKTIRTAISEEKDLIAREKKGEDVSADRAAYDDLIKDMKGDIDKVKDLDKAIGDMPSKLFSKFKDGDLTAATATAMSGKDIENFLRDSEKSSGETQRLLRIIANNDRSNAHNYVNSNPAAASILGKEAQSGSRTEKDMLRELQEIKATIARSNPPAGPHP